LAYLHGQGLTAIVSAVNTSDCKHIKILVGKLEVMSNIKINFIEIGYRMWSGFNWPLWPCHKKTQFLNVCLQFGGCLGRILVFKFVILFLEGFLVFSLKSD
jgi:hypothetical protein